jgi:hypothetical protein
VVELGVECFRLPSEIFDLLPKGGILGKRCNACERWLGCSLHDAVCATGCSVQVDLRAVQRGRPLYGRVAGCPRCCEGSRLATRARGF